MADANKSEERARFREKIEYSMGMTQKRQRQQELSAVTSEVNELMRDRLRIERPEETEEEAFRKLEEGEQRRIIKGRKRNGKLEELETLLIDWINDTLVHERIIVKDLADDLYDGHVLQKMFEVLTQRRLHVPEVVQSEIGQKQKLKDVLNDINAAIQNPSPPWTVELVHSRDLIAILQVLVALVRHYCAPIRLPDHVTVRVVTVTRKDGRMDTHQQELVITLEDEYYTTRGEKDAFDTLFDYAPDKLNTVKKILIDFANVHLAKLNMQVTELDKQFHDGVYLVLLMGLLHDYFVPFYAYCTTPSSKQEKIKNVQVAFELMADANLPPPKARPEDIVNMDLKSTLRILYTLYSKYKNLERSRKVDAAGMPQLA